MWWRKSNEGDEDKIKRVQAARERSQRLKFGAIENDGGTDRRINPPTVNSPGYNSNPVRSNGSDPNAYVAYEDRQVGGGGAGMAPFTGYQDNDPQPMNFSMDQPPKPERYKTTYQKKKIKINTVSSVHYEEETRKEKHPSSKSHKTFLKKNQHKYNPKDAIIREREVRKKKKVDEDRIRQEVYDELERKELEDEESRIFEEREESKKTASIILKKENQKKLEETRTHKQRKHQIMQEEIKRRSRSKTFKSKPKDRKDISTDF